MIYFESVVGKTYLSEHVVIWGSPLSYPDSCFIIVIKCFSNVEARRFKATSYLWRYIEILKSSVCIIALIVTSEFSFLFTLFSMESEILPTDLKVASVKPLLKKQSLCSDDFKNFTPISNLSFLFRNVLPSSSLIIYMPMFPHQSTYRKLHSTDTALIRVHNDIAIALDQKRSVILLLLDLSVAFDTVDHCILLPRLSRRFGIGGTALEWFRSYLGDRTQFLNINGSTVVFCSLVYLKGRFLALFYTHCTPLH